MISIGDKVKIKKLDYYREGMLERDIISPKTYTTVYTVLLTCGNNTTIQVDLGGSTGTWWIAQNELELVPNKNVIGGKLL